MELFQLEYFLSLAKYQNVSMAADFLNISQPALSKCLAQIEHEVGIKLFDRIGRHIYLNEYGKTLAHYVEQSIASLNMGILSTRRMQQTILGTVNIGIFSYGSILFPSVARFAKENPLVNIRFTYNLKQKVRYSPEDVDLILCSTIDDFYATRDSTWVIQPLFTEKYVLVISPRFREYPEEKKSINLLELKDDPFVAMFSSEIVTDLTYKYCNDAGFSPMILYESEDFQVKLRFLQEGLCVAFLPECCVKDAATFEPSFRFFDIENFTCERTVLLKRRKKAFMSDAAKSFWDFMIEDFNLPEDTKD